MAEEILDIEGDGETDGETDGGTETPNVKRMREKIERQEAELAELRPLRQTQVLADAGFDPESTSEGKVLKDLMNQGLLAADKEAIIAKAAAYGWEPTQTTATKTQKVTASNSSDGVVDVTSNIDQVMNQTAPLAGDDNADWQKRWSEAEKAGNVAAMISLEHERTGTQPI